MITMGKLDDTPVGTIWVAASEAGLVAVSLWDGQAQFVDEVARLTGTTPDAAAVPGPIVVAALDQLAAYLRGELRDFDLPLDWSTMRPFQRAALERVCAVAYGRTSTYGTIADELGQPGACLLYTSATLTRVALGGRAMSADSLRSPELAPL